MKREESARRSDVVVFDVDVGGLTQALECGGQVELEDEVIGAEAGDVAGGVEAFEGVVELVGEKDGFEAGLVPDFLVPGLASWRTCQPGRTGDRCSGA